MIYLPTECEEQTAQAVVDFPWDMDGIYSPNAVMTAIKALNTGWFCSIRHAMDVMEDHKLTELIEWMEYNFDTEWGEPTDTLDMTEDGYFADVWDMGYDHFRVVIQNNHWNQQMDIDPSAGIHGIGPLCEVYIHVATVQRFDWENAEFISMDQQKEFEGKFRQMAEDAVSIYKQMNENN